MKQSLSLTLADSEVIVAAAELTAGSSDACVSIALIGGDGHLLLLKRLDGASAASCDVAIAKARICLLYTSPSPRD